MRLRNILFPLVSVASLMGSSLGGCGSATERIFPVEGADAGDGDGGVDPGFIDGGVGKPPCVGLQCQQVTCPGSAKTTISGTVYDPAGNVPLYNVVVYVPNSNPAPFGSGATCDKCGSSLSGNPIVTALTDTKGHFSLANVPVGANIPLVMQVGKWRRQIIVPAVGKCVDTPIVDKNLTRLPRNQSEGDIPLIALTTGGADTLECLLRKDKIGLDDSEFTTESGTGRVHLYGGSPTPGATAAFSPAHNGGAALTSAETFWSSSASLKKYDVVLLSCEGNEYPNTKQAPALQALFDYTAGGGRVFASHWHEYWFSHGPMPFPTTGTWNNRPDPQDPAVATIDTSFPKGLAFRDWMVNVSGSSTPGQVTINVPRHNLDAVTVPKGQQWITLQNQQAGNQTAVEYMSFNTPVGSAPADQCGRVVYSDLHVASSDSHGPAWPDGCTSTGLSAQEKALEFMLFDLSACILADSQPPMPPPILK
jgi:hypothetical protein